MSPLFTIDQIGSVVATLSPPPSSAEDLASYAQASGDTNPLHLDRAFARKAGFGDLVVHGMLGMAHMGRLLTNAFPCDAIKSFSARFSAVILVGERVNYHATLASHSGDDYRLALVATTAAGVIAIQGDAVIDVRKLNDLRPRNATI
jgi:acyl dehydratase